jgi:nifR3 family TIM-barrel protein
MAEARSWFLPDGALILAPMADYTDSPLRRACRASGADAVVSEMVPLAAVVHQRPVADALLAFTPMEHPIGVQLATGRVEDIAPALERILPLGFDFVDLNAGCPMRNTTSVGAGAALLRDPARLEAILREVVARTSLPVTVKVRLGWSPEELTVEEVVQRAQDAGVAAITVHPRTRAQMYRGQADWGWIARLRRLVHVPLIGNGDVLTRGDAERMRLETGCDAVMIGRAAVGNPWIFSREPEPEGPQERFARVAGMIRAHFADHLAFYSPPRRAVTLFRKHLARYFRGIPHSREWRNRMLTLTEPQALLELLDQAAEWDWAQGGGAGGHVAPRSDSAKGPRVSGGWPPDPETKENPHAT